MPRKGRELETLVALIERVLSPTGAAVRSPDYLQDRITGERREVDISIRSKVGSVELLLICECRDRASVQDVTWIEQIAQKRKDVGASKAVAISSSAFTEPALKKARFLGIDTRLVRDLSAEAISDWFTVGVLTLSTIHADVVHASFNIARYIGESKVANESQDILRDTKNAFTGNAFVCKPNGERCSLSTIWSWVHEQQSARINASVPVTGEKVRSVIQANFQNPEHRYQIPMIDGLTDIVSVNFTVDLWCTYSDVPISQISSYSDEDKEFLQTVRFEFNVDERRYCLNFHNDPKGQRIVTAEFAPSRDTPAVPMVVAAHFPPSGKG